MKRINIISETIYKGQHKLVNQGAFVNMSKLISDIFACFNIPCCDKQADYFVRKSALIYSRKKPGANWQSLNKLVLDVYNCCKNTTLCSNNQSQWWITSDVIRPKKTVETINFTNIINKVLNCCGLTECGCPDSFNFKLFSTDWAISLITDEASFLASLISMSGSNAGTTISNFTIQGPYIGATVNNLIVFNTAAFSGPDLYSITALPASVDTLNIASQSFVQADLDLLAGLFLGAGTLPKSLWDSSTQTTTDQPSLSVQADLTADVTSVTF
jgi:hypothetical protein